MPPISSSEILTHLRQETRPYHDALEQNSFNQALSAGHVSQEATVHFLRRLYGFLAPYEEQLRRHQPEFSDEWELSARYRAPLLLADLAAVSAEAPPLCPELPPLHTRAQLLGAMYVLEGSTLGGQVITRQLAKAGIPLQRYFNGYGELTGPRWKTFCRLLTEESSHLSHAEISQSAVRTFQLLYAWINQP
ncbi:biliverdin-producing heme oxygenase [Hymenobacter guriensis]|uniref:Biliverdin-producing heme oxygenase n=1 Tax=Hymenobacter guriensis TaxID=2793065 RepID=A0ABS0KXX5_9BACT|nr:biliverdin-producing heme oxygenase [Hymenobacter guriensis]MBG8552706.1 biliverdin-producing heme oxygenase [Hymenobacter guriensis]